MAHRLVFHPAIPDDLADAIVFYEQISSSLGDRFREMVKRRLAEISERPESFPTDVAPIRFARVERFPYLVFFVPRTRLVSILAIAHGGSDPEKWRGRANREP